jgi:DNA polymerase III alpha subunit
LDEKKGLDRYPRSVFDILVKNKLDSLCLVEDSISGFLEANKNCIKHKIKLLYGLRLWVTEDALDKKEENLNKRAKYVIFIKNNEGYKNLIKISSWASKEGFYYEKCIDWKTLKLFWSDENLLLCVPFYDSFLHLNSLENHLHTPDFNFTKPIFFIEDNDLPFDYLIKNRVEEYTKANNYDSILCQTILYPKKEDFIAWLTFKAIGNRSTLEKPDLSHCGSDMFSSEHWEKLNG